MSEKEAGGLMGTLMRSTTALLGSFWGKGNMLLTKLFDEEEVGSPSRRRKVGVAEDAASPRNGMTAGRYDESTYNLQRVPYKAKGSYEEDEYWLLRSGMPFPSYHANPTRDMPARWIDIEGVKPPVEDLRAPRIRLAPQELERRGRAIEVLRMKAEAEEKTAPIEVLNLGYQDLGDHYQQAQLSAFLAVNKQVRTVSLTDNNMLSLLPLPLPSCQTLYLSRNQIITFNALPPLPSLESLYISSNFISTTTGLSKEKFPRLKKIVLEGNPIVEDPHYREKMKKACATLRWVDGMQV